MKRSESITKYEEVGLGRFAGLAPATGLGLVPLGQEGLH